MAENPTPTDFDTLVDVYDLLIDWPKRLSNEGPFFRKLFAETGVRRVLDAACGAGHHAAMFHRWGLAVEGADLSPVMIARCRERFGDQEGLRWTVRSFENCGTGFQGGTGILPVVSDDLTGDKPAPRFDAVVCVGNSLALAADLAAVGRAIASMIAALRPGGVGVVQVLNLWAVPEGPTRWQKCKRIGDNRVILKGLHRVGGRGFIDLIDLRMTLVLWHRLPAGGLQDFHGLEAGATHFLGIEAEDLSAAICSNGGRDVRLYGGYQEETYDREVSADLICLFRS